MYKSYVPYLQHILDECLYVRSVIKDDMQREEFLRDETLKRAVTRSDSIALYSSVPHVTIAVLTLVLTDI